MTVGLDVLRKGLCQRAYYWEYQGVGDYGKPKLGDVIEIKCRWHPLSEKKQVNPNDDKKESRYEVHVDRQLVEGSFLQLKRTPDTQPDLNQAVQIKTVDTFVKNWNGYENVDKPSSGAVNYKVALDNG